MRQEISHADMMQKCRASIILLSEIERTESALSKVVHGPESPDWSDLGAEERSAAINESCDQLVKVVKTVTRNQTVLPRHVQKATLDLLGNFEKSEGRLNGSVNPELFAPLIQLIGDSIQRSVNESRELFCKSLEALEDSDIERFDRRYGRFRFMALSAKVDLIACARRRGQYSQRLLKLVEDGSSER